MKAEPWMIWMGIAAIMLAIEIVRVHSFFIWLSAGAASAGILALLGVPVSGQIVTFINLSGILILLERRFSERYTFKPPQPHSAVQESINRPGVAAAQEIDENLNVFRKWGELWEIRYADRSCTMKHSIGLVHIRNLIIHTGKWIHCSELRRISLDSWSNEKHKPYTRMNEDQLELENLRTGTGVQAEQLVDRLSLEKLRKLRDILRERKESDDFGSPEDRIDQLKTLEFIEKYLRSVTDKSGCSRKALDQEETDRKAISIAISRSRNNLRKHQELFIHLKSFIQAEGNSFRYLPDRPIDWKTE